MTAPGLASSTGRSSTPSGPRVVFLGGLGRSGSTLLERLLGELPGANAAGELVHLWQRGVRDNERCGCGCAFEDCEFWPAVGARAFGGWSQIDPGHLAALQQRVERTRQIPRLAARRLHGSFRAANTEYAQFFQRLYRAIGEVSGSSVVIDSSKHASLAFCLRWAPSLDLRVIHLVRDSRAVAYSWTKQVHRPEAATAGDLMTRYSPSRSAQLWVADNLAFELLARRGVPLLRVRYEDLTADPARTLATVAAFAGLPVPAELDAALAAGLIDLGVGHTVSGNPMRFTTGPVPIREDLGWHDALPARDRRLVTALTAPLLLGYGYPLGTRR